MLKRFSTRMSIKFHVKNLYAIRLLSFEFHQIQRRKFFCLRRPLWIFMKLAKNWKSLFLEVKTGKSQKFSIFTHHWEIWWDFLDFWIFRAILADLWFFSIFWKIKRGDPSTPKNFSIQISLKFHVANPYAICIENFKFHQILRWNIFWHRRVPPLDFSGSTIKIFKSIWEPRYAKISSRVV